MAMRRLQLKRNVDIHGISGTGIVAEGVEFNDGSVVMQWLTETATTVHYKSLQDLRAIHVEGHGDEENNEIIFLDDDVEKAEPGVHLSKEDLTQEISKHRMLDFGTVWAVQYPTIKNAQGDWIFDIPPSKS